jgi:hypothetical protein
MNPKPKHAWSPEMVTMLETLWSDGQTDRAIARAINRQFKTKLTRNAIQGKLQTTGALGKKTRRYRMSSEMSSALKEPEIARGMSVAMVHLGYFLQELAEAEEESK